MRCATDPLLTLIAITLMPAVALAEAQLSASHETVDAGASGTLVVAGTIADEQTFGIEVVMELVPRAGAHGSLVFTPAPPVDIFEMDDPWPGRGSFSPFDTDMAPGPRFNGFVGDDGVYLPAPVAFDGNLAAFPFEASGDAGGVWDVVLANSAGTSGWVNVPTTLVAGSVTVLGDPIPATSSWTLAIMASVLLAGGLILVRKPARAPARIRVR